MIEHFSLLAKWYINFEEMYVNFRYGLASIGEDLCRVLALYLHISLFDGMLGSVNSSASG